MPSPEFTYFIDTSFHLSYCFADEDCHQEARAIIDNIRTDCNNPTFITTDIIFAETINHVYCSQLIKSHRERQRYAIQIGNDIIRYNKIVSITPEIFILGWKLFVERNQQGYTWSFADCNSLVFIREIRKAKYKPDNYTIKKVLSFDKDFIHAQEEFGFKVIRLL